MTDLKPTFEHYFPDGSHGGECAAFAEKLYAFGPVGDLYLQKLNYFQSHGSTNLSDIQVGDILLLNVGKNGHVCVVNADVGNGWRVTESNWNLDGIVHHTRIVKTISVVAHLRAPIKVQILTKMETFKITVVDNIQWPDMAAQVQQFADLVKQWSGGKLALDYKVFPTNFDKIQIPLETYADIFKGPTHDWLHANLDPLRNSADVVIFNEGPAAQVAEQGYTLDPDQIGGPFYLILTTGITDLFKQEFGLTEFTKLCLHELSHALYHITGGEDKTHYFDYTPGHALIEAYQTLDYAKLSANLALRRQQKVAPLMSQVKLVSIDGEEGIFLAAADQNDLNVICKIFGKDPTKVEVNAKKV